MAKFVNRTFKIAHVTVSTVLVKESRIVDQILDLFDIDENADILKEVNARNNPEVAMAFAVKAVEFEERTYRMTVEKFLENAEPLNVKM